MKKKFSLLDILVLLLAFLFVFVGCQTTTKLSSKAQQQNVIGTTSETMVAGMTRTHSYLARDQDLLTPGKVYFGVLTLNDYAIFAANKAADEGQTNITVLLSVTGQTGVFEISYWKK
jgi:hypothetical protein